MSIRNPCFIPVAMPESGFAAPLCRVPLVVAISDFREGWPDESAEPDVEHAAARWRSGTWGPPPEAPASGPPAEVVGGYLERLPLACVRHGLAETAEIWHHWRGADPGPFRRDSPALARRSFRLGDEAPPFRSNSMLGFVRAFGAPKILCVWGLGVDRTVLDLCANSFKIYNSIDAPALRIPPEVSAGFDLVLTGAEWQSDEVRARHPDMPCAILPIGPEFADPVTFHPLGTEKPFDVIYVAAAQPYKRHDILFDSLSRAPRRLKALCVFGYGEIADDLRRQAAERNLDVSFVGPPGVDFAEVNRLMNLAKVGVVCGVEDGAPAILTEYMLAGLPVLANANLRCGLQYILPSTGRTAEQSCFGDALVELVDRAPSLAPRQAVLARWTWPRTMERLIASIAGTPKGLALVDDAVHTAF